MTRLRFNGARTRPFTVKAFEQSYYIEPEVSREVEVSEADAASLLEVSPDLWSKVEAAADSPAEGLRANKTRKQAAADDGKG